jgi:hypothetical protein
MTYIGHQSGGGREAWHIDAQLCDKRKGKTLKSLMERLSERASG